MAVNQTLRCYHHSNCEDRPAVARCSKCGKGLCRECADNLKSEETGKILCVDCLNEEMAEDVVWAESRKNAVKKEMIFIIIGFVMGLAIEIFLFAKSTNDNGKYAELWFMLWMLSLVFFLPTLLASFRTIIKKVKNTTYSVILRIILFIILCVVSPIIFIWRIVKRAKDIKRLKMFSQLQFLKFKANEEYADIASKMTTRLTTEEFERNMALKYSELLKTNKEEAEKQIAEEREKYNEAMLENDKLLKAEKAAAAEVLRCQGEMAGLQAQVDETNKKAQRNAKKAKKESRSTVDVDDDIAA